MIWTMPGLTISIRRADSSDARFIAEIYSSSKRSSLPDLVTERDLDMEFQVARWTKYIVEGSTAQFAKGDGYVYFAEADGIPVGYIAWHSTARHGAETELQSLYILRECQNMAVGSALLTHIAREVLDHGATSMCVGYDGANPYRRFYIKHGAVAINDYWAMWPDVRKILPSEAT